MGLHETMPCGGAPDQDRLYAEAIYGKSKQGTMNCQSPFSMGPLPPGAFADLRKKLWAGDKSKSKAKASTKTAPMQEYGADVCGGCGAASEIGLLTCSKCKTRKYCCKECQKAHWKNHKPVCFQPEVVAAYAASTMSK
ncbi:hypothetical protein BAUCODRAFT_407676 [Baudoinia panamericana UAMH 10762]|uniref:MYND-type domain-containing protein n=1 Tax=Baudoinia panamericana (strain UAMH 10762) TaxID=717646 RepID=M2NG20_BAUPA|nr:uncharacterized protein BAUCODRAFT_407676 [Baudoinia panamericana UAMH 10762]EMC97935.1 hypothetical protein BAUCODRAFT_407676 [Baudoinia panamericana UAMH 10762]